MRAGVRMDKVSSYCRVGYLWNRYPVRKREVDEISKLFPPRTAFTFVGKEASKQRVLQTDLTPFRFLHFATHGLMPTDSNLVEPALAFSIRSPSDKEATLVPEPLIMLRGFIIWEEPSCLQVLGVLLSACGKSQMTQLRC